MKIGILTLHYAQNYGALLQAYALQEHLKALGHDAEIVDYRPDYLVKQESMLHIPNLRKMGVKAAIKVLLFALYKPFILPWLVLRSRRFKAFRRRFLKQTVPVHSQEQMSQLCHDAFFLGSDQIWNPNITGGMDKVFTGDFVTQKNAVKNSYAASAGNNLNGFAEMLGKCDFTAGLNAISVREPEMAEILHKHSGKDAPIVLDPTILADPCVFKGISAAVKPAKGKYVLVYMVATNKAVNALAESIASQIGAKIIKIWAGYAPKSPFSDRLAASPEEFLSLFEHAECVVTTSFHGIAFSVIYRKSFYYLSGSSKIDLRAKQLLGDMDLLDRAVFGKDIPQFTSIDWAEKNTDERIGALQSSSGDFIKRSLEK